MGTLVCTIELDKNAGLTVTVENANSSVTQTVKLNGTTIELKVSGPSGTSTFTQSADKIAIACKDFEVVAQRSIKLSSSGPSSWHSDQSIALDAPQAVSASTVGSLTLEGTKEVTVSGGQATVKANVTLQLESSALTTLKGQMTNVQGNLVNIG